MEKEISDKSSGLLYFFPQNYVLYIKYLDMYSMSSALAAFAQNRLSFGSDDFVVLFLLFLKGKTK